MYKSTIFQSCPDGSSKVAPVLSRGQSVLLKEYVVCNHYNYLNEVILMITHNTLFEDGMRQTCLNQLNYMDIWS